MTLTQTLVLLAVFLVVAALIYMGMRKVLPNRAQVRLKQLDAQVEPASRDAAGTQDDWVTRIAEVTEPLSRIAMPEEGFEGSALRLKFVHAGLRHKAAPAAFFGIKSALTLGLPLLGLASLGLRESITTLNEALILALGLAAVGYYLPNVLLQRMVTQRQREIFEALPDAIDLMTVCVEAGQGTEAAMIRVSEEMSQQSPVLSDEFKLVNLEIRAGANRELALRNLYSRTGVDEVDSFATMLAQAERFGTSISASLRVHSDMLRTSRRQAAEEAAAKVPLKLLFPLMTCIFPTLLVVLLGPAIIQIFKVFSSSSGLGG